MAVCGSQFSLSLGMGGHVNQERQENLWRKLWGCIEVSGEDVAAKQTKHFKKTLKLIRTCKYGRLWQPIFLPYWYRRFCIWKLFGITYIRHVLECLCTIISYKYTALWRHRPTHALYSTNWPVLQNFIQKLIKTLHVCSTLAMFTGCFLNILDVLSHTAGSDTIFESSSFWGQYQCTKPQIAC